MNKSIFLSSFESSIDVQFSKKIICKNIKNMYSFVETPEDSFTLDLHINMFYIFQNTEQLQIFAIKKL